jgi:catechol 2,3-dioxygenase-like lactoylglutathione lyase family enzyme
VALDFKLELVVVPVSDVDRAKAFYADTMGFDVDVDHTAGEAFRVVQLTPPGSACSITIGTGVSQVTPGTYQGLHLVVTDIEAARAWLVERGAEVSQPFHFGPQGQAEGVSPGRGNYESYLSLSDPDGNGWLIQEVGHDAG